MAGVSYMCWDREELLSAYLDGELRPGELDVVVRHLDECPQCLGTFHAVKEARAAVRLLPQLDPPSPALGALHVGDQLSAYLDGELVTHETEAVTAHLAGCGACREELHELDAARTAVRALPRLDVPLDLPTGDPTLSGRWRRNAAAAAVAIAVAATTLGLTVLRSEAVVPLDLDNLATRHNARVSVDPGFSVIPASVSPGSTP